MKYTGKFDSVLDDKKSFTKKYNNVIIKER